jgi:hypothetical protein
MKDYREQLDGYQFQMGLSRGRLAMALDVLTDALALVGQHGIYCRSADGVGGQALDIRLVIDQLEESKALIIETMKELNGQEKRVK